MQHTREQELREILRAYPGSLLELLELGKLLVDEKRYDGPFGALPVLLRAVMRMENGSPLLGPKWSALAEVYIALSRPARALEAAQKSLMLSSIRERQLQHRMWRVIQDACSSLELSIMDTDEGTPSMSDMLATLAEVFNQLGEYDRAVDIGNFIEDRLNTPSPRAFNAIGYAYRQLGDTEASERAYAYARHLLLRGHGSPKPTLWKTTARVNMQRKTS